MKLAYYNPKKNNYQFADVEKIENDTVFCLNKKANYQYQESLKNLLILSKKDNPNWHGLTPKPLIKFIGFNPLQNLKMVNYEKNIKRVI